MMRSSLRRRAPRRPWLATGLAALLAAALPACDSQSVFEGDPLVAPPVTEFDRDASADRAIHGGVLPISVVAVDRFVGVDSIVVRYSGALSGSFTRRFANAPSTARIDTVLAVPFGVQGEVVFEAWALNRFLSVAQADTLVALIVRQDTIRPVSLTQQVTVPARAELGDTIRVQLQAQDDQHGGGIVRLGVIIRDEEAPTAPAVTVSQTVAAAVSAGHEFRVPVTALPGAATARPRRLNFVAFAIDQAGNCTAVGAAGTPVPCSVVAGQPLVEGVAGAQASMSVTETRTYRQAAPTAAQIGDLVVDVNRRLVYISNQANNSVDAISWGHPSLLRTGRALVGAAPRGMTIENGGNRLIVANSGGTSLSYVDLGSLQETSRYETPNASLWQISAEITRDTVIVDGIPYERIRVSEVLEFTDFSDRPQFVGQDATGAVFYSTPGAVRWVETAPGWQRPESGIMLWPQVVPDNAWGPGRDPDPCWDPDGQIAAVPCVIAGVDSIKVVEYAQSPFRGTVWEFWAHQPGNPQASFAVRGSELRLILEELQARGARPFMYQGTWDYSFWETGGNMFVTSSGNREWVNFADTEAGRVWNWGEIPGPSPIGGPGPRLYDRRISQFVNINDYENNTASEPITAVALNHEGSAFVSRSGTSLFFFNNPLRLLGSYAAADIAGGAGVGIHPGARLGTAAGSNLYVDWAAAGSAAAEIVLVETRHFRRVGTVPLLEPLGGPLRVIDRLSTDAPDVVAHIFGVTRSGAVFHVPVRHANFTP